MTPALAAWSAVLGFLRRRRQTEAAAELAVTPAVGPLPAVVVRVRSNRRGR